jgi:hypothetical protein
LSVVATFLNAARVNPDILPAVASSERTAASDLCKSFLVLATAVLHVLEQHFLVPPRVGKDGIVRYMGSLKFSELDGRRAQEARRMGRGKSVPPNGEEEGEGGGWLLFETVLVCRYIRHDPRCIARCLGVWVGCCV